MKLQMFKNCKIDNVKNVSFFSTIEAQNDYYEGLITAGNGFEKDINFNKLGEPFIINYEYGDILEYNYGRFKLSDKWYYFSVEDLEVNTNGKTKIIYQIDAWETSRLQFGVSLGVGTVFRASNNNIFKGKINKDIQPNLISYSRDTILTQYDGGPFSQYGLKAQIIIGYKKPTETAVTYYLYSQFKNAKSIISGYWINSFKNMSSITNFANSDITGVWIVPYGAISNYNAWSLVSEVKDSLGFPEMSLYTTFSLVTDADDYTYEVELGNKVLKNTYKEKSYLTDMRGEVIFTPQENRNFGVNKKIKMTLSLSPTSTCFECYIDGYKDETLFILPCEPVYIFGDSYNEYFVRQREYDMATRRMNNERQLIDGIMNVGQSTIGGGILGGMSDQTKAGLIGGTVLGVASSLGQYALNNYYAPKEQKLLDDLHKKGKSELLLYGERLASFVYRSTDFCIITETWDSESLTRYESDINTNGFVMNYPCLNCSQFYNVGVLSGDFEINGNIPNIWKNQINSRFRNGVRVIE